ncbi:MAG: hydroxyethylthiazole kinase [Prevotellaceae bacterium]|nr:hydroxyethylthiazole kinase [Prevotellaceae bacterium]
MKPLVHCITNYVAMNFTANALLAVGAEPLMSFCPEEMGELVAQCDALMVNIGCIDRQQVDAMKIAVAAARDLERPWVLDPVAVNMTEIRLKTCTELIKTYKPSIIRGNQSEIAALCSSLGLNLTPRALATYLGCVVVQSGKEDVITDGKQTERLRIGHPMMADVTATGCVSSALCAAFMGKGKVAFDAAVEAMTLMGKAGEKAALECKGTGSFIPMFLDNLYGQK